MTLPHGGLELTFYKTNYLVLYGILRITRVPCWACWPCNTGDTGDTGEPHKTAID